MAETRTPDLFDRLLARNGAMSRPEAVVPLVRPRPAMPFERLPAAPGAEHTAAPAVVRRVVERLVPPAGPVLPAAFVEQALEQPAYPRPVADTPAQSPARAPGRAPAPRPAALPVAPRPAGETRRRDAGSAPAEPSVQVSIGRLEVTTAAPEPKRERDGRSGRPEPAVGLEAFLDRHSLKRQEAM